MNLNDYIALSSERPNRAVLQGLGASEELIEYLMETQNNTNWNVVESLSGSKSSGSLVLLDWTFASTGEDGDKTEEDWYASLYFSAPNFNTALINEGDTLSFEVMNGEEYITTTTVIRNIYHSGSDDNGYIGYYDDLTNNYNLTYYSLSNEVQVFCSAICPFPNAQDAWVLPTRSYDYSNTKIKITNLGVVSN